MHINHFFVFSLLDGEAWLLLFAFHLQTATGKSNVKKEFLEHESPAIKTPSFIRQGAHL